MSELKLPHVSKRNPDNQHHKTTFGWIEHRPQFYQTRSAWSKDQGSIKKRSAVHNFVPTVTIFCVLWEGLSLPHDTKCGNCRGEIVDRRVIFIWSLILGSSWSCLIKVGPVSLEQKLLLFTLTWLHWKRIVVMMQTLSLQVAPMVVIMTTWCAMSDDKVGNMTTLGFSVCDFMLLCKLFPNLSVKRCWQVSSPRCWKISTSRGQWGPERSHVDGMVSCPMYTWGRKWKC